MEKYCLRVWALWSAKGHGLRTCPTQRCHCGAHPPDSAAVMSISRLARNRAGKGVSPVRRTSPKCAGASTRRRRSGVDRSGINLLIDYMREWGALRLAIAIHGDQVSRIEHQNASLSVKYPDLKISKNINRYSDNIFVLKYGFFQIC